MRAPVGPGGRSLMLGEKQEEIRENQVEGGGRGKEIGRNGTV